LRKSVGRKVSLDFIRHISPNSFWLFVVIGIIISLCLLYYSFRTLRTTRIMEDTPTSQIRSAAQGYIELEGCAVRMDGEPVVAPLTGQTCVWYCYSIEERSSGSSGISWYDLIEGFSRDKSWTALGSEVSDAIFQIKDDTGECIIDPDNAEVTPSITQCWYGDSRFPEQVPQRFGFKWFYLFTNPRYRYTEKRIHDLDPLYAMGMFLTLGSDQVIPSIDNEVRDLLSSWKRDKQALLKRFDLNGDGTIDIREWAVARKVARKSIQQSRKTERDQPMIHVIKNPSDGQMPFLLSAVPQKRLISRSKRYASLFAVGFFIIGLAVAWATHFRLNAN